MRTGRLAISRGHQIDHSGDAARPRVAALPSPAAAASMPVSERAADPVELLPDHELVDRRLGALERLTRLAEVGALSAEEFADEKALILGRLSERSPAHGPVSFQPAVPRAHPRSLAGRLFGGWRAIPVGLLAGLGLSFATQPEATLRVADELLRLFGV